MTFLLGSLVVTELPMETHWLLFLHVELAKSLLLLILESQAMDLSFEVSATSDLLWDDPKEMFRISCVSPVFSGLGGDSGRLREHLFTLALGLCDSWLMLPLVMFVMSLSVSRNPLFVRLMNLVCLRHSISSIEH